jgi:hypothetical protein
LSALVLILAVVVVAFVLSAGSSNRALPAPVSRTGLQTILEDEVDLHSNPEVALGQYKRLGVDRVRVYVAWSAVAPDPTSRHRPDGFNAADPAAYPPANWGIYDEIVRDIKAHGMGIDLTVGAPPPLWARGPGDPGHPVHPQWKVSAKEFGLFMQALGKRYSGSYTPPGASSPLPHVGFWSIWNEPNFGPDLAPQTIDKSSLEVAPTLYRHIVDASWTALRMTGHGHDTILIGELAPAGESVPGPGMWGDLVPLRFLRAMYCVGSDYQPLRGVAASERGCPPTAAGSAKFAAQNPALFHASGFADHPYSQGLPPNKPTPNEPDYAELADLPKLERTLDTLQRVYGSGTRFPIWSTEFGYQTTPPDTESGTVSPQQAAAWLNWSEYLSWRNPRVMSYDQYLFVDPPRGNFASGLLFANGKPKPGYYAFRMPIYLPVSSTSKGQPLEVWGCVRPARYAHLATHKGQQVKIQFQSGSAGAFHTVQTVPLTDPYGYFDVKLKFPGSGAVRLSWRYPHGPTIFSRTVPITLH